MREVRVHGSWMHRSVRADEVEQGAHVTSACGGPRHRTAARVHQCLQRARDEPVVDEEVLMHVEPCIEAFEIAGAIAGHAVAERQILRAGRGTNWICLDKGERIERALECGRGEQAARDGESPQLVESHADGATWPRSSTAPGSLASWCSASP